MPGEKKPSSTKKIQKNGLGEVRTHLAAHAEFFNFFLSTETVAANGLIFTDLKDKILDTLTSSCTDSHCIHTYIHTPHTHTHTHT